MLWSEFNPYVLPYVLGAPYPLIEHHVRLAAIDFCRRTACLQRTLDPVLTNGTALVTMVALTGEQVNKVKAVAIDGHSYPLVDAMRGYEYVRSDSPLPFCFTQDNMTLQVYPEQVSGVSVVVDVVIVPAMTSTSLDDTIANAYMQDIAQGAIASLQRVPGQSWTDMNGSALAQLQFNSRVSTIAAKVSRGFMNSKMRSRTTYL